MVEDGTFIRQSGVCTLALQRSYCSTRKISMLGGQRIRTRYPRQEKGYLYLLGQRRMAAEPNWRLSAAREFAYGKRVPSGYVASSPAENVVDDSLTLSPFASVALTQETLTIGAKGLLSSSAR